jgi:hypothetical protein
MIKLPHGPGKPQLVRFGQMIIDGVHDHSDHALVRIPHRLAHRCRQASGTRVQQLTLVE